MNVGTVGVVIVGDGLVTLGADGLLIVGEVLDVEGDVFNVDGELPTGAGVELVVLAPVVPITPLTPVDDNVVLVGDVGAGDIPIELVGAGIVDGVVGVNVDGDGNGDGDGDGDGDGRGDVNVVGEFGVVTTDDVPVLDVPTLGLDMVPGPGIHGNGAVIGAD